MAKTTKKKAKAKSKPKKQVPFFSQVLKRFNKLNLPTKLFIISLLLLALAVPYILRPILVKADSRTVVLIPTDDGHVNKSDPSDDYGEDDEIKSDKDRTIYMKYDLTSLTGLQIEKAELRMYITESSKTNHQIRNVSDSLWSEKTLVYNNRPVILSEVVAIIDGGRKGQWKTIDVTSHVLPRVGGVWSFAIESEPGKSDSLYFYSNNNKRNKPELVVTLAGGGEIPHQPSPTAMITQTQPSTVVASPTTIVSPTRGISPTTVPTKIPTPTSVSAPTNPPSQAGSPADVIDLYQWKLTLPTGSTENPREVKEAEFRSFTMSPYYTMVDTPNGKGLQFRAPVNGVTTSGSDYPRSELREMKNSGKDGADWSSTSGTHTMYLDQAITHLPKGKQHVVAGQIHDDNDDVIVIRLEGSHLFINTDAVKTTLTRNYVLGTRFNVTFVVSGGKTQVYYNGTLMYTLNQSYSKAYFKAGAYTQSNCQRKEEQSYPCDNTNYGEVVIYKAEVTHQ